MKHVFPVAQMTYNKIVDGTKKIHIALFDKISQQVRINDTIEFVNASTREKLTCIVNGFVLFDNFASLINNLPPELLGYDNREEIKIRVERLFKPDDMRNNYAVGFFISRQGVGPLEKIREENYLYAGR